MEITGAKKQAAKLEGQGFKCTHEDRGVKYYSKNSDHRVILADGTVKRGQPEHRNKRK